jgi:hypothetical protein
VNSITNMATNTVQGFMEDLSLLRIPAWWQNPWLIALALLLLIAAALFRRTFYLRRRMRTKPAGIGVSQPGEPPHLVALRQLADLRQRLPRMEAYDFNIECSRILRTYVAARFDLPILFQTTREFLEHVRDSAGLEEDSRMSLGNYLHAWDAVKFGRREMTQVKMGEDLGYAEEFVNRTAALEATPK